VAPRTCSPTREAVDAQRHPAPSQGLRGRTASPVDRSSINRVRLMHTTFWFGTLWCRMGGPLPDDVDPSQAELLRIDARYEGADAIITVAGELDHSTTPRFLACFREALDTQPRSIVVDGHGLTFTDSSGLAALLRARGVAQEAGVAFRVSSPSPKLRRFVELTGTKDYLLPDN
jgi:anti-sigma B factor antagonist